MEDEEDCEEEREVTDLTFPNSPFMVLLLTTLSFSLLFVSSIQFILVPFYLKLAITATEHVAVNHENCFFVFYFAVDDKEMRGLLGKVKSVTSRASSSSSGTIPLSPLKLISDNNKS